MSDWCENTAIIEHREPGVGPTMIQRVVDGFRRGALFSEFMPTPAELLEYPAPVRDPALLERFLKEYSARDWYDWQMLHWGVKEDVGSSEGIEVISDTRVRLTFRSMICPPTAGYRSLCDRNFEIEAFYHHPVQMYCGHFTGARGGKRDDYMDYASETAHTVRREVSERVDQFYGISERLARVEEEHYDE